MWLIWLFLIVAVPLLGLIAFEDWRNKRIDKENEMIKQQEALENSPESV
jgi:hypothetical protein